MGRTLRRVRPGIVGLVLLPRHHWEAIEADLTHIGRKVGDVGTRRFDWVAFRNWLRYPRQDSAVARVVNDGPPWQQSDYRLADIQDILGQLLYSYAKVHKAKTSPDPQRIPAVTRPKPRVPVGEKVVSKGMPFDEVDRILGLAQAADEAGTRRLRETEVVTG